jgi:ketosteroid isomerase-like protein
MNLSTPTQPHAAELERELDRLVCFFEQLAPSDLDRIALLYAPAARFKDPFNEVQGVAAIEQIFRHMFESLHEPRFVVTQRMLQGREAFLCWDFVFRFQSFRSQQLQTIRGATQLRFDEQGRVELHRDYWDAAEELYEKLPLVGSLMRWLKRRVNG